MPDLTIEYTEVCEQLEPYRHHWHVGKYEQVVEHDYELSCTCLGFKYRNDCKHVKEVAQNRCTWHGHYDEKQKTPGICPRCGGKTVAVGVAV